MMKPSIFTVATVAVFIFGTCTVEAQRVDRPGTQQQGGSQQPSRGSGSGQQQQQQQPPQQQQQQQQQYQQQAPQGRQYGRGSQNDPIMVRRNQEPRHYSREHVVVVSDRMARPVQPMHDDHRINYRGMDYSYSNGHYYRENNGQYLMVEPPHGIRVNRIPENFITLMVQSIPYFYFEGVYYRQVATEDNYEVVAPPMGAIVPELPQYDVKTMVIDGKTVLEYDNVLYKPIVTSSGVQYKVVGILQ